MTAVNRLDADFAAHPMAEYLDALSERFDVHPLDELLLDISSGHTPYKHDVSQGQVGFATVECVSPLRFHEDRLKRITKEQFESEFRRQKISKGSILCTIKRRICQAYPWIDAPSYPLAINQDIALLKPRPDVNAAYLACYLSSKVGQSFADRQKTEQINPYISLVNLRTMPVVLLSETFQIRIETVFKAISNLDAATNKMGLAAIEILLSGLGLKGWTPPEPLTYVANSKEAFSAGRLDAQYFRPLFAEVEARLLATGSACELGSILSTNARGRQPQYADDGLPVINSKHVRTNRVILADNRTATEAGSGIVIETGDVLVNGTGEGTIGRAAPYLHGQRALPDNHVTVLRTDRVDPVYLAVFLNSPLGQRQIERHIKGSSGQVELYPSDIARIMIWEAPDRVQQSVRAAILSAFDEERRANDLLEAAKRAVEIAIEDGEPAAMAYLDQAEGAI